MGRGTKCSSSGFGDVGVTVFSAETGGGSSSEQAQRWFVWGEARSPAREQLGLGREDWDRDASAPGCAVPSPRRIIPAACSCPGPHAQDLFSSRSGASSKPGSTQHAEPGALLLSLLWV